MDVIKVSFVVHPLHHFNNFFFCMIHETAPLFFILSFRRFYAIVSGHISVIWEIGAKLMILSSKNDTIYLYSLSKRSVILTSSAFAIASSWYRVGEVFPFSILLMAVLLIPDSPSNCFNVIPFTVRASHVLTVISLFYQWCVILSMGNIGNLVVPVQLLHRNISVGDKLTPTAAKLFCSLI